MNDLRPWLSKYAVPAESQIDEGGGLFPADRFWNCVFACVSVALQVYGYPDVEPADLRQLVQPGTHAGSDFGLVATYLRAHPERWPGLPPIRLYNPSDTLGAFASALDQGRVCIFDVWDDRNAAVQAGPVAGWGGTHAVILESMDATSVTLWNPWRGEPSGQTFTRSFIQAATTGAAVGNLMVFERSIVEEIIDMMTDSERKQAIAENWWTLYGEFPPPSGPHPGETPAQYDARMKTEPDFEHTWPIVAPDRTNLFEIWMSMFHDPRAVAYRARLAAAQVDVPALAKAVVARLAVEIRAQ